jgi:hypothetical protein
MVKFALGRDLVVMGTWTQRKDIHKVTWRSPDKNYITRHITYWLTEDTARIFVMREVWQVLQ